ncbi:hypothetical protein PG984_008494 [Apiospora sp. TS-2023a]
MEPHRPSSEAASRSSSDNQFQFISIQNPVESHDRETRRKARSHAIRQSWQTKRRTHHTNEGALTGPREQYHGRVDPLHQEAHQSMSVLASIPVSPPIIADPFEAGPPTNGTRFRAFLGDFAAVQATEPVFSIRDSVVFQTFHAVFRTGLEDAALLNAVMLTFAFAAMGGADLDQESLGYQSKAISSLRGKISSVQDVSALEVMPTIGAILLLAGVEARLGEREKVEIHMTGVKQLLDACRSRGVYLTDGIKRAIFWQDLNSAVLTGSRRLFTHTSMNEMKWTRDVVSYQDWFTLPPGFEKLSHLLPRDFVEVIEDVHTLQHMRDSPSFICQDTIAMLHVDNHQAWSHLSAQLMQKLQDTADNIVWDQCPDLLTWMVFLGGTFASTSVVRNGYVALLHRRSSAAYASWQDILGILRQFIWSKRAFEPAVKGFYDEVVKV